MDRPIFYSGSTPRSTDVLTGERQKLVGLGYLIQDLLGVSTVCTGLACTPTAPASMSVAIAAGRIYQQANVENSTYGILAADTAHQIVKQGILYDPINLSCPAPTTSGQSINYLIEAAYQDVDTNLAVLSYFNSANPAQPFSGPPVGGVSSGTAQATVRAGQCVVQVKAGIPATTGTQTTPAPDVGYVGLYVVTVAFGASTIVSGNISKLATAPLLTAGSVFAPRSLSGSFNTTMTGVSGTPPTGTIYWYQLDKLVQLILPAINGTSNANTFTLTGLPAALQPPSMAQTIALAGAYDNGTANAAAAAQIVPGLAAVQLCLNNSSTNWTPSGTKGLFFAGQSMFYTLQ